MILVFGTGIFLRGFVADFAERAGERIVMVSSTPSGDARAAQLSLSGGAFPLAVRGLDASGARVDTWREVGAIWRTLTVSGQWDAVLETATDPEIDIVVSNVTESALRLADDPQDDLPSSSAPPASFPARLTLWLYERWQADLPGVVVLPCELIENNATLLRGFVEELASRWELDEGFLYWLDQTCAFADTLVDRIVTGAPPAHEAALWQERLGREEPLLCITEPYTFWAIRGDAALRERLGALAAASPGEIVVAEDITPYVLRKVRLLNGLHTAMASIAPPRYGVATVREALEHPELGPWLEALLFEEILPAVCPPLDEADARGYAERTLGRMRNPFLEHRLAAITVGAPVKWELRLLPVLAAYEERFGSPPARLSACRAAFLESAVH